MKTMIRGAIGVLLGAALTGPVFAQQLENAAEAFGRRPAVSTIALSPNGDQVVFVGAAAGRGSNGYVASVAGGEAVQVVSTTGDPGYLRWCRYSGPDRIVCSISWLSEDFWDDIIGYSRLIAMDEDGGNAISFAEFRGGRSDGRIVDWLTGENNDVLLSRFTRDGLYVLRFDTVTGDTEQVERPNEQAGAFVTDGRGNVRIMMMRERRGATGMVATDINTFYRRPVGVDWQNLSTYNTANRTGFFPAIIDPESDTVYGFDRVEGRSAVYRMSLNDALDRELLYSHDSVDVGSLITLGRERRVIGIGYAEDRPIVEYFDPEYAALAESLSQALPDLPLVRFVDTDDDGSHLLIWAGSDTDPGRYYVFDRNAMALNHILDNRPALSGVELSPVEPIEYPAADGTMIPGYLTLPRGRENEALPTIIMPHGGPEARDVWGFDWLAQFFAHQGYAVLQPNFRGSAGYGNTWLAQNGFRNWELAVGDINDGARWLISRGIADPNRLAGVGWSYGGYAVLQSATYEPSLFNAVVAIAPVTDLPALRREGLRYTDGRNLSNYLGNGPHIEAGSPARNAERIIAPVLLFHGDHDVNVHIDQSRRMHDRLEDAGRDSELVIFEGLEHNLDDSAVRTQMLERIDQFLSEHLGG